ncbi:septal ring lytic transglycosylase RlpA family protein [Rubrobacter taiwanensis]|nr:septal ring lytic transglycosylase RlpA family protein [Rubrobacter taiwanensis]
MGSLPGIFSRRFLIPALLAVAAAFVAVFLAVGSVGAQQQMVATWYGPGFEGNLTASGEPFDPNDYTAAHRTLDFGTKLLVTYGGNSVVVRVNDRGPFSGADLDLSRAAADAIGLTAVGTATVDVQFVDPGTPTGPYSGPAGGGAAEPQQQAAPEPQAVQQQEAAPEPQAVESAAAVSAGAGVPDDDSQSREVAAAVQYEAPEELLREEQQYAEPVEESVQGYQYGGVQSYQYDEPASGAEEVAPSARAEAGGEPVGVQQCVAFFGGQGALQYQYGTDGSLQNLTQAQVQYCQQIIQNITVQERVVIEEPAAAAQEEGPVRVETEEPAAAVGTEIELPVNELGIAVLPDTGGAAPLLPLAGGALALLLGGGILIRRIAG